MTILTPLIHADPERSGNGELLLPGTSTGFTTSQVNDGYNTVTPVYSSDGIVESIEINPRATTTDICAVLHSCGILVQGLAGDFAIDQLSRPIRYSVVPDPEIGENIISLVPIPNQDIIY